MRIFQGTQGRRGSFSTRAEVRVALTVGLTIGVSLMALSARAQTITACVNNKSGAVTIISSGSCKKGTHAIVLNPAPSPTLTVQTLNVVDSSNHTVATLGKNANGNQLTFFDAGGNKTMTLGNNANESFTGLATFDNNNNIIAGTGVLRTAFGESNPNAGIGGFGASVFDGNSVQRTGFGLSFDLSNNDFVAINADGSSEGIGSFSTGFDGYYANDASSPASRQYGGLNPNGDSVWGEVDTNGVLRVSAVQQITTEIDSAGRKGNGFAIWDPNGLQEASMAAFIDGSLAGFNVVDPNNIDRISAYLYQNVVNVDTRDGSGNVTGHLP
jgi:hypothetical protein